MGTLIEGRGSTVQENLRERFISYAAPCLKPKFIPAPRRLRGAKRLGIAYERALAKALPAATHGQWFEYREGSAPGWCQTDLLLESERRVVVVEVKLTDVAAARKQLDSLYLPVLRAAFPEKSIHAIVALRHVTNVPEETPIFDRFSEALWAARDSGPAPIFHWLGKGPIG